MDISNEFGEFNRLFFQGHIDLAKGQDLTQATDLIFKALDFKLLQRKKNETFNLVVSDDQERLESLEKMQDLFDVTFAQNRDRDIIDAEKKKGIW